jgi:hypothetical protein
VEGDVEDLVRWLGEQADEDDRVQKSLDDWHARNCESIPVEGYNGPFPCNCGVPERMLRETEAKRKLLVLHRPVTRADFVSSDGAPAGPLVVCHECDANTTDADWPDRPCWTLRYLAAPYADRPGYKEAWRP